MFKDPEGLSAMSVAGIVFSTMLLTREGLMANPITLGWKPFQPLYVAMLAIVLLLSILGIWRSIKLASSR